MIGCVAVGGTYLLPPRICSTQNDKISQSEIAGNCLMAMSFAGLIVTIISSIIFLINSDNSTLETDFANYGTLLTLGWFVAYISMLSTSWAAIANAHGYITGVVVFSILPQATIFLYLFYTIQPTIKSIIMCQLLGVCLQSIGLAILYREKWNLTKINYKIIINIIRELPLVILGSLCFSFYSVIDALYASQIGPGVMSYQAISQRLVLAFSTIISVTYFMLTPSITATLLEEGRVKEIWIYTLKTGIKLCAACFLASLATPTLGMYLINTIFQNGKFSENDGQNISDIIQILLLGVGPMLSTAIAFRVLHNMQNKSIIAFLSIAWVLLYFVNIKIFMNYVDLLSLSLSYVVSWIIVSFATYFLLAKKLKIIS